MKARRPGTVPDTNAGKTPRGGAVRVLLGLGAGCGLVVLACAGLLVYLWSAASSEPSALGAMLESDRLARRLRALPFRPPADGAVPEERLLAFLESRSVFDDTLGRSPAWQKAQDAGELVDAERESLALAGFLADVEMQKTRLEHRLGDREEAWIELALAETAWDVAPQALAALGERTPRTPSAALANRALFRRHADRLAEAVDVRQLRNDLAMLRRRAAGDFGDHPVAPAR